MTTRTGTPYQPMSNTNSENQFSNQTDPMLAMLQSFHDEMRASLNNINKRLENLGTPKVIPDPESQVHILRETNLDNRMCDNIRIVAPSFDGNLDPNKFLNWLTEFEEYYKYHKMEDDHWVGLARMKLEGQARNFGETNISSSVKFETNRLLGSI